MSLWWVFDKQLWFNLKESKRDYLSSYFRLVIGLLNSVPPGPSITILYGYMGIMGYELQRIP